MKKRANDFLAIATIIVFIASLTITTYSIERTERFYSVSAGKTVEAEANVRICIDVQPPVFGPFPDNLNATVGEVFNYRVDATSLSNNTIYFYDNTTMFEINRTTGVIEFTPNSADVGIHAIQIIASHEICPGICNQTIMALPVFPAPSPPGPTPPTHVIVAPVALDTAPPEVMVMLSNAATYAGREIFIFCSVKDAQSPIARNVSISAPELLARFSCSYNDSVYGANCMAGYTPGTIGIHNIACAGWDVAGNRGFDSKALTVETPPAPFAPFSICGNGICESAENQDNCCLDCGCPKVKCSLKCVNNRCSKVCCLFGYCCKWRWLCWYWWIVIAIIIMMAIIIYLLTRWNLKRIIRALAAITKIKFIILAEKSSLHEKWQAASENKAFLNAIHAKIKKLLALDHKEKILCAKGTIICKKINTKQLKAIKELEAVAKPDEKTRLKLEILKVRNKSVKALMAGFSGFNANINSEIGWITNEAGSLTKREVVKKAAKEEAQCITKQKDLVIELRKQVDNLKPKKKLMQITAKA